MSNERVSVNAVALNALCEAVANNPLVHPLMLAVRNSVAAIVVAEAPAPPLAAVVSEMEYGEEAEPDDADPNS